MARMEDVSDGMSKYRVKRTGKNDTNDLKFFFGKIHGIENIAFMDEDTV
jgi:ABC-type antimicrobial peptide transport system permease subunit